MELTAPAIADFARYRVEPGEAFAIAEHDAADTGGLADATEIEHEQHGLSVQIAGLQERLYAEEKRSLLIVLQGIDAAGKDGRRRQCHQHAVGALVPADHRWFRNYVIARILAGALEAMNPQFPAPPADVKAFAERELEAAP